MKNKKDGGRKAENFFLAFKDVFWKFSSRWLSFTGSGQIQRKTKNPVFITILGLKDCGGFKADKRCHDIRWYRSRFLQTLVVIFPRKSTQVKIHTKMAIFWLVFCAKNPVKSDKLALIKGKILNLMFLDINIPVVHRRKMSAHALLKMTRDLFRAMSLALRQKRRLR